MSMVSMGVCGDFDRDDPRYRVLSLKDPERGRYVEVVVASGQLVGATCIGDADVAATLSAALHPLVAGARRPGAAAGAGARRRRHGIRREAAATSWPTRTGCARCNWVTAGRIREAVHGGCRSVADVAAETRASTGCGDCAGVVGALRHRRAPP